MDLLVLQTISNTGDKSDIILKEMVKTIVNLGNHAGAKENPNQLSLPNTFQTLAISQYHWESSPTFRG